MNDTSPADTHPVIVTITGPSGSGKTVLSKLLEDTGMRALVSTTTRAPRQGEEDGKDYHFIDRATFAESVEHGRFIENVEYNGVLYGVSVDEAEKAFSAGQPAVLVAEPHGVAQIADYAHGRGWSVLKVFVDNPEAILVGRLFNRLLLDVGLTLPGAADRPHESFKPFIDQALALSSSLPDYRAQLADVMDRFVLDQSARGAGIPSADRTKRIAAAAQRLSNFGFEQQNWVEPARAGRVPYDIITDLFDQSVQQAVVDRVLGQVVELQEKGEPNPAVVATARRGRHP